MNCYGYVTGWFTDLTVRLGTEYISFRGWQGALVTAEYNGIS